MCSPSPGKKRMNTDVIKLMESNHEVTVLGAANELMVKFFGPSESNRAVRVIMFVQPRMKEAYGKFASIYRKGIPSNHPLLVGTALLTNISQGFINKIYHPNIDEASGTVCLDVINQQWSALYDLTNIFESFLPQLLAYPNPTDPLNSDAASLFMFKPSEYVLKVKEYVQRFATEDVLKAEENGGAEHNSSDDESSMSDYTDDETKDMEL
ncbi:hypothetical protein P879_04422 [Paragonimus westermani]|uniref:UBC core domain-containing protein n=1 Tax=Paragonimus westermani TaxID=34504 RepID=A0A8T0DUH8_9TREM|nr:hypothetical protein P879_04422 [Paragonimus westermani]